MVLNFGPPMIDFSPLGKLGETYDRSRARTRQADIETARTQALSTFGQNGDLAALGNTLLRAGDLEGGMSALRFHAANSGTPWQREQAAREDARHQESLSIAERERQKAEEKYQESLRRADRPQRYIEQGRNEFGEPTARQGWQYPDGRIEWDDGAPPTAAPRRDQRSEADAPGPASQAAAGQIAAEPNPNDYGVPTPNPARERGYVIPGTLEGFPHGTVRRPAPGPVMPATGLPNANAPAPGVQPQQATLAPPGAAGPTAVAAPVAAQVPPGAIAGAPVAGPPITATQINQGTSNIAPMSNAEMIAEARRLGISPGQYREARASAIKKEMEAKSGAPDAAKNLGEQAGKLAVAEQYLANAPKIREAIAEEKMTGLFDRTMAVNKWGERGAIQNQIESGVDALVHMMTGAGMNESEARRKVGRYEPALLDNKESLLAKHDHLVGELKHWRELAYRGKGTPGDLPLPTPAYGAGTNSITLDNGIKATW
jgi:hypothetical protein